MLSYRRQLVCAFLLISAASCARQASEPPQSAATSRAQEQAANGERAATEERVQEQESLVQPGAAQAPSDEEPVVAQDDVYSPTVAPPPPAPELAADKSKKAEADYASQTRGGRAGLARKDGARGVGIKQDSSLGGPTAAKPASRGLAEEKQRSVASAAPVLQPMAPQPTTIVAPEPSPDTVDQSNVASTEGYDHLAENSFLSVNDQPLSTFSIDVDTASYSNVRRMLNEKQNIPSGAVRIEELVNYFSYDYPNPDSAVPFSVNAEVGAAPWNGRHQLVRIGLQGKRLPPQQLPARNLVFLIDVSGSMSDANKLPLLVKSLAALTDTLNAKDHVAMVVYAGASGLVLEPTAGNQKQVILDALQRLEAGGSTNGASGIELAYQVAQRNFRSDGVNRVILATDGDFNVGPSSESELVRIIEDKRKGGVYLTVLGFGMGNYKDSNLEQLADHGNGNYAYIDNFEEAHKVLVEESSSTLVTIAKDVKIQVEFNPRLVGAYRLIGYENRKLENRDFHDDTKDAGEIGAGHSVTALYELVPPNAVAELPKTEALKYQAPRALQGNTSELLTVKLRYKQPTAETSQLLSVPVAAPAGQVNTSDDFRFAAAVASFGMLLRQSPHRGSSSFGLVQSLAQGALGSDPSGRRKEFLSLVKLAQSSSPDPENTATALSIAR
ncbi:MAG TPA: VWA domain-containing protein [Polyangiaceae bacterium]|jgi:Ca-activated chloride channel family protein|nr:VWA domain-containing protein [Polyangiaceae bacterium]